MSSTSRFLQYAWILLAVACAGCAATSTAHHGMRLAMVTDTGGLGDKSFNDSAYLGLREAQTRYGASIEVLQARSAADFQPDLTVLANQGNDEIIGIGFLMTEDLDQIAQSYPHRHFALIDSSAEEPNILSVTFREHESSFLAGALAAMTSKTRTIAFLGGIDVPILRRFEAGFTAGARQIDPRVKVLVKYVGSFGDVASGKELASVLFDQDADVVFTAAGKSGLGAFDELRNRPNAYLIGVDADQDGVVPGRVLTSVLKHVDAAVVRIARDLRAGHAPHGHLVLGLAEGGVGLTPFTYTRKTIGAKNLARLETLRRAIVSGRIVPPATREELAAFNPVRLP